MASSTSVIIPTLNEEAYLPHLLESLKKVSTPLDIIVVDGASEDDTAKVVEKYKSFFEQPSSLRLVRSEVRGIALQRNRGAELAKYDALIFCDADVIFPLYSYERMLTEFNTKKYIVAAPLLRPIERGFHRKFIYQLLRLTQKY